MTLTTHLQLPGCLLLAGRECLGQVRRFFSKHTETQQTHCQQQHLTIEYYSIIDQKVKTTTWTELYAPSLCPRQSITRKQVCTRSGCHFIEIGTRIVFSNVLLYKHLNKDECKRYYKTSDGWLPRIIVVVCIYEDGIVCRPDNFFDTQSTGSIDCSSSDPLTCFFVRQEELRDCQIVSSISTAKSLYRLLESLEEQLVDEYSICPGDKVCFKDDQTTTTTTAKRIYQVISVSWKAPAVIDMLVTLDNYLQCTPNALEIVEKANQSDVPEWHSSDLNALMIARYRVGSYFHNDAEKRLYRVTALQDGGICAEVIDKQTTQVEDHVYIDQTKLSSYVSCVPVFRKRPMADSNELDPKRRRGTPDFLANHKSTALESHEYIYH